MASSSTTPLRPPPPYQDDSSGTSAPPPPPQYDEEQYDPILIRLSKIEVGEFILDKLSDFGDMQKYALWKQQMLRLIQSGDLLRFIYGKMPPRPGTDEEYDSVTIEWRIDMLVKGWILGMVSDDVLATVANLTTARDVWWELGKNFGVTVDAPLQSQSQAAEKERLHEYIPLYKATLEGDWNTAIEIIDSDPNAIKARISATFETALHIAVGTGKAIHFVENLVKRMPEDLLGLKDESGYTPLHVAALMGNREAAEILVDRRHELLYVPDYEGRFPVHLAAFSGHKETLSYLISQTMDGQFPSPYVYQTGVRLLITVIDAHMFDVALDLAEKYPDMATLRLEDGNSALKSITYKESAFSSGTRSNFWKLLIYSFPSIKGIRRERHEIRTHEEAINLVKCLCMNMESLDYERAAAIYSEVMLIAAHLGVHEVIELIVATIPAAIYFRDPTTKQYIFHVAVQNRSEKVFNLIYQTSGRKHHYFNTIDSLGNNLLHLAARLAPPNKLNLVSGAALQMQREIQWFKEVENILHPASSEHTNKDGKTPKMVFTEEHIQLKAEGEKWMKDTANSCSIAAALIATVVFAAAITVPGGNQSDNGLPMFSEESAFIIFAFSDAISLFTSTTSLLMFLSILTSRYAEEDFLYALPKRLCIGLCTLFFSILFMMFAFSATLYLVFGQKKRWILIPVGALACFPVISFGLFQIPLLVDVISSTYGHGITGKQSDRPLY